MSRPKPQAKPKRKPQPAPESRGQRLRRERATDWKLFRLNNLFTQKKLAEVIGVCRRTIQQVEGGQITPRPQTLRRFAVFKEKCRVNEGLSLQL